MGGVLVSRCFRYFKDTKMKVSDVARDNNGGCFRYFKDTKMKANHNWRKGDKK